MIPVCIETFTSILHVSRFRLNRLTKKDFLNESISEKRGGFKLQDVYEEQVTSIAAFLESLQCSESHYCRSQTLRKYLAPELNINKLYDMYLEQLPENKENVAKRSYFRFIFNTRFNFGFGSPQTDRCSTCISFSERIKVEQDNEAKQVLRVEYAIHKKRAKAFFKFLHAPEAQPDGSELLDDTFVLSFDCEKNLQLLKVPDSAAYYSRNLYLYNFTIVNGYSTSELQKNIVAYCWTENEFLKNANLISSCLLYHLQQLDLTHYKHIKLVCDGCAAQNKNSIVVTALLHWLNELAPPHILDVQMIFPVTGHSYIPPDRVFGQIEKQVKKRDTILAPEDYLTIISRFATVKKVGIDVPVFDVKTAMTRVLKPCSSWPFSISKIKRLLICQQGSKWTIFGELFYEQDIAVPFSSFCKRGKTLSHLVFAPIAATNKIDKKKEIDLFKLLVKHFGEKWRDMSTLSFFVNVLGASDQPVSSVDEDEEDVDDPEPCVFVKEQPELII